MESIQPISCSSRQLELINTFKELYRINGIEFKLNEIPTEGFTKTISVDVEHNEAGVFVGCGMFPVYGNCVYYFSDLRMLRRIDFQSLSLIAHNGITDLELLRDWGIDVKDEQLVWDTMLMGHIIDSSVKGYGLKSMAKRELGIEYPSYDDIVGKRTKKQKNPRITLDKQPVELVGLYCGTDCYVTGKIYSKQLYRCPTTREIDYFDSLEKSVSAVFHQMATRGICVDLAYLKTLKENLERQMAPIKNEILNDLGPINLNSPKQLLEALNDKGIWPNLKGKPSTDKRALAYVQCPIVSRLLEYSELDTLISSFVTPYLERNEAVIHPFFNQCGTRTGRPSCSNPNLLQIPRRTENGKLVRRMFIPRSGMLMGDCDFGQIEPRVMAHLSKDPVLCKMFNDGIDFHTFTAERMGISRDRAKVLNLSVGYRATFKSVSAQLRCSNEEAQKQIDGWWNLFPGLRRWQEKIIYDSKKSGFCTTLLGRRIQVDDLSHGNSWRREGAERQLINNITQGSAAEIMKRAMIRCANYVSVGLLVQVYDELLFESPNIDMAMSLVKDCMVNSVKLDVPLTVDGKIGSNWSECK